MVACLFCFSCSQSNQKPVVESPGKLLQLTFSLSEKGVPAYQLTYQGNPLLGTSALGFIEKEKNYQDGFTLTAADTQTFDETWEPVWGQFSKVRNHYNELTVKLTHAEGHQMHIVFRLYDDGLGFRYVFPATVGTDSLTVLEELTSFRMLEDHTVWWVPGCWDNDEYPYTQSLLSKVDATHILENYKNSHATTITKKHSMNTPATMRSPGGLHLSIHEAALVNFPGMSLEVDPATFNIKSHLAASAPEAHKAVVALPYQTPWRTLQVAEKAGGLITSYLIQNLNEPNKLANTDFIKPMKYAGIWWEMHVGKSSWDLASGKHGATTRNAKAYIDFCAENNIPGLLIEGWNTGWENWLGDDREGVFDFTTPYPDFDITEVVRYAKEKGVYIIGHHETAAAVKTYEARMDTAYRFYQALGIHALKSGYVGKIPGHTHYDQWMVNHYNRSMEKTAAYQIMLNIHEPIKPTGLCRTYPNLVSAEGMRGMEFNAWSDGNPPTHQALLPFTRNLAGPMDYTPGIFDIKLYKYKNSVTQVAGFDERTEGQELESYVKSTLASQLALYVVFYSPIQMVADLPENYAGHPAMQFIRDVGVDWSDTQVLGGEVGEYVSIARKEKGTDKWFLGSITNESPRVVDLPLAFLDAGKAYVIRVYKDAPDAHWDKNPTAYVIEEGLVTSKEVLSVALAAGGGVAIHLQPATEQEQQQLSPYSSKK